MNNPMMWPYMSYPQPMQSGYGNYGMQQYQPQQLQPPQPQPQSVPPYRAPTGLAGRMVNSSEEITPNEVPMDGSVSLFPKSDFSCIYAKAWNQDGTIKTVCYVPQVIDDKPKIADAQTEMLEYLKRIEETQQKLVKELGSNA